MIQMWRLFWRGCPWELPWQLPWELLQMSCKIR
jgi:hypothetical protein